MFSQRILIGRGLKLQLCLEFRYSYELSNDFLFTFVNLIVGADGGEGPPVPIPNTEVKLVCVENTWRATTREDR